jgi:hypothetical protein
MSTNITPEIKANFHALASGKYNNFALFSCFVNGEPAVAIVVYDQQGESHTFQPLFVSITPGMKIQDHDGREPEDLS